MGEGLIVRRSGVGGSIKSIQHGIFDGYNLNSEVNINEVDPNKSIVVFTSKIATNLGLQATSIIGKITSATTLGFYANFRTSYQDNHQIDWSVIEFQSVKSIQKGEVQASSTRIDTDINISPVNINKTLIFFSTTSTEASNSANKFLVTSRFLSSSSVRLIKGVVDSTAIYYYQIVEFN